MKARISLHRDFTVASIDDRVYGAFIEHLGRAIYGGIYEPGHPTADADGFRADVLELVRELRVPVIRYPGGNFVSAYNWEDGIGPKEARPVRLDLAWHTRETNQVGIDEFARWCERANIEMMLAVNLGSRGIDAARSFLEYCNHPSGTAWSDLRRRNGREQPYNVRLWCLGNEMDGPWQVGHKTAFEYGRLADETAKAMKAYDSTLELVVCGSSFDELPTFPQWEAEVLEQCYDNVDYISLHRYFGNQERDHLNFLAKPVILERFIRTVSGVIDYVKAKKRSKKNVYISFDEWNVWYHSNQEDAERRENSGWPTAPALLEDRYTFEDVLVVGSILNAFIRNADRIKIACIAQLVNVIAPIMTETGGRAWRQTIYYPLYFASLYGRGDALHIALDVPTYDVPAANDVPYLDLSAVRDRSGKALTLFAVNRHPEESIDLSANLASFVERGTNALAVREHLVLVHPDLQATNTAESPHTVTPNHHDGTVIQQGHLAGTLPPRSYNVIRIRL